MNLPILKAYISITRPDNWTKNIVIFAGVGIALMLKTAPVDLLKIFIGLSAVCFCASANYVLNEYLDAHADTHHPVKNRRPGTKGLLKKHFILTEYAALAGAGLLLARLIEGYFTATLVVFLICGILYNVPPLRVKDVVYCDVLLEGINSPLRVLLGWFIIIPHALPPSSLLLLSWAIGAFLMDVKRCAEYRLISDAEQAAKYRKSYKGYSDEGLIAAAFFYALLSAFSIAAFLLKYRIEFIIAFPFFCIWFTWYLSLGMKKRLAILHPEKLYQEPVFVLFSAALFLLLCALRWIDIVPLHDLLVQK